MINNYFKIHKFKKDMILVFFDDTDKGSVTEAYDKITKMNKYGYKISVWMHPLELGPWDNVESIF